MTRLEEFREMERAWWSVTERRTRGWTTGIHELVSELD